MSGLAQFSNWVAQQSSSSGAPSRVFLWLMLGGLLASLLPCVYPLYPITATIVQGRAGAGVRWTHPLSYYAGLVSVYGVLGLLAGLFGGSFNALLHYAATNLVIGLVLVWLAAATAGWVRMPLFGETNSNVRSGLSGTWLMGMSAGLMSSACVGPVVVGVLIGLATTSSSPSLPAVLVAGAKMLVFGFGLGLPFLLVALVGVRLPRSGSWMLWVQRLIAVALLVFARDFFIKALETWGFEPTASEMLIWAAAVFMVCVILIQAVKVDAIGGRFLRSLYALGLVVSAGLIFRGVAAPNGSQAGASSLTGARAAPLVELEGNLTWNLDKNAAYAKARQQGRPVFIDFFGSWCTNCKAFQALAQSDAGLNSALLKAVLLKVEDTTELFEAYQRDARFPELKVGLPFFVITDKSGSLLYKTSDYTQVEEMELLLHE